MIIGAASLKTNEKDTGKKMNSGHVCYGLGS